VLSRLAPRALLAAIGVWLVIGLSGFASAGESDYDMIMPLVWVLVIISAVGAAIVYAYLVYAVYKFRDPQMKRNRHG
jgi:hypothetical protein